jgi:hypothetical protein
VLPDVPPELLVARVLPPVPFPAPCPEVVEDPPEEDPPLSTLRLPTPVIALQAAAPPTARRTNVARPR